MDIGAISSRNLLIDFSPSLSLTLCISLPYDDGILLCTPNFMAWWFRLHDGLLRLRDNLVAHAWLSSEFLLRPRSRPKTVYQKNYHPHMMERLWSTFLSACTVIHLHEPAKDFRELPSLSLPLQGPLDLPFTPHKWQRSSHSSLDLFQSLLMFCAPFKISSSLGHLVNG